jgi:BirA family biotin operon repressor/biotin-[acetyl-CoA-carboxylase] ligase
MSTRMLVERLADGEFHSGEELGAALGVSRAAVWKQLQRLREATGLAFESVRGRGYRLPGGIELLQRESVLEQLSASCRPLLAGFELHDQIDSTNRRALSLLQEGAGGGWLVSAEQQLAGRGRRGRQWQSPYGRNLYCSLTWVFEGGAAALEGLSLAVGVAVIDALVAIGVAGVGLKWPNDVIADRAKLAGILLEMAGEADGRCQVVVGIGINVNMRGSGAEPAIDQAWTDVATLQGAAVSRNQLLAALLEALLPALRRFESEGFAPFRERWSALDAFANEEVVLHLGERMVLGRAIGVNDQGALGIDTPMGRQWFHGGEVSLRLRQ